MYEKITEFFFKKKVRQFLPFNGKFGPQFNRSLHIIFKLKKILLYSTVYLQSL